jgi:hypothetical protein
MDPLGFSLENYDAIGHWRTHDGKFPIAADAEGLKQTLLEDRDAFARCLASKLATYALGRKCSVRSVSGNETFSQLVEAIVTTW